MTHPQLIVLDPESRLKIGLLKRYFIYLGAPPDLTDGAVLLMALDICCVNLPTNDDAEICTKEREA